MNGSVESPWIPKFASTFVPKALSGRSNTRSRVKEKCASFTHEDPAKVCPIAACCARVFSEVGSAGNDPASRGAFVVDGVTDKQTAA